MSSIRYAKPAKSGLVSVVIPTRDGEKYIGDTLASVSRQTHRKWEVIVVEDGSTGPVAGIVQAFARRHPLHRVRYERHDRNRGASAARNTAFALARGEFVALLDSDDRWLPDHLELSLAGLTASGKDLSYATVVTVEDGTDRVLGLWGPEQADIEDFPHSIFNRNFVTPSATVMRRQVLADVGPWDTRLLYCEDLEFWLRCIAAGKQFQFIGGPHCLYRKCHAGATTQKASGMQEEFAQIIERYAAFPGMRAGANRRYVGKAYERAARNHLKINPQFDPSADRYRAAELMFKAWRARPKRVEYLLKGSVLSLANFVHGRRPAPEAAPLAPKFNQAA